jgi:HlyD family secretion protein
MEFKSLDSTHYLSADLTDIPSSSPSRQKLSLTKGLFGLLSLILLTGGYLVYQRLATPTQQSNQRPMVMSVERENLSITVSANGTIEPEQVVNVSPKTAGVLTKLWVEEGDTVSKGQVIAYMDDSNLQGQLTQAQGQLAKAQADLDRGVAGNRTEEIAQAQARLASAQADLKQAEADLHRNQDLFEAGAIARQAYDKATTTRDTAQAKLREVQQALALSQAGSRPEEIASARAQVESAQGALQTIQAQINDTVIRAPFGGVVSRKYADPGAFVAPTTAGSSVSSATSSSILSLASTNRVVANVAESSIAQIQVGQSVVITADAYPGKTFQGRVSQIATQAIVEQNVTSFEVKVALVGAAAQQLRSGMNVSAKFQVGQLQNVLTVPTVAVTRQNNVTGVFVGAPHQPPKFVAITPGATLNNRTEVKAGLTGTEHILINVPSEAPPPSGFSLSNLLGSGAKDGPPGGGPPGGAGGLPPGQ